MTTRSKHKRHLTSTLETSLGSLGKRHLRLGWSLFFVAMTFGLTLESLLGFKVEFLMLAPIRREFWSLAHFHGALFGLVNLVYVLWAENDYLSPKLTTHASLSLAAGSVLLPLGFFLGGLIHYEGDPGLGFVLIPIGAVCLLYAAGLHTWAVWRSD